jgi:site-specific recombinase XerD
MPQVNTTRTRREDGSPSNWDRYLDLLIRREVPAKSRPWYVRRVEDFLRDLKPAALSALTADQVTDYLRRMSARSDLADWQMRQIVDALRLLLVDLAQVPAGKGVDWDDWWEGQRTLAPEHATIARSTALSAEDGADPTAIGVPRFSRSAQTFPILEDLARTIRAMQYSIRTEQSYVEWCHRFLLFCGSKPLDALGVPDVQRFLSHLAVERSVSAKTQSLAYNAVAFLFKHLLERPLEDVKFSKTRKQARLPVVLSRDEMRALLAQMDGTLGLMARLMYGTGMRLMECVRLRVLDLDFDNGLILVRNGKGGKDRAVPLPQRLRERLQAHLTRVEAQHRNDLAAGGGAGIRGQDQLASSQRQPPLAGNVSRVLLVLLLHPATFARFSTLAGPGLDRVVEAIVADGLILMKY